MVKQKTYKSAWKSDEAEATFRTRAAVLWDRAKRQPEAIDVATQFGSTRAYRWSGSGPPLVLLHGMTDTSVRWIPFAEALDGHDVYAIDVMGETGHSSHDIGFTSAADYAVWLDETLDALGITQPHIVGYSLGGYIAFSYAMRPGSVRSLIGFDPVGVVDLKLVRFIAWGIGTGMAAFAPRSIRHRLAETLGQPLLTDKAELATSTQAQRGRRPAYLPLPEFTDEQLQSITVPVRVLVGAKSTMFDLDRFVRRINDGTSQGQARLLPGAGHGLVMSHLDECIALVREMVALPSEDR